MKHTHLFATCRARVTVVIAVAMALAGCTAGQIDTATTAAVTLAEVAAANNSTVAKLVNGGALFCQKESGLISAAASLVPVVAVMTGAGAAASVLDQSAQAVAETCAKLGAVPVSPPVNAASVPMVAVATALPAVAPAAAVKP